MEVMEFQVNPVEIMDDLHHLLSQEQLGEISSVSVIRKSVKLD